MLGRQGDRRAAPEGLRGHSHQAGAPERMLVGDTPGQEPVPAPGRGRGTCGGHRSRQAGGRRVCHRLRPPVLRRDHAGADLGQGVLRGPERPGGAGAAGRGGDRPDGQWRHPARRGPRARRAAGPGRGRDAHRRLPARRRFFCGREEEFRQVARALADPAKRGFGIWGMGGIGKTALAKEAARRNAWRYRDGGIVFLDARELAPPTTAELLRRVLARFDPAAPGRRLGLRADHPPGRGPGSDRAGQPRDLAPGRTRRPRTLHRPGPAQRISCPRDRPRPLCRSKCSPRCRRCH